MILTAELTGRNQYQPRNAASDLDQDTEEEEEDLVEEGEVDTSAERDDEDLLDHDGGIDEDIGGAQPQSDEDTGDRAVTTREGKS